MKTERDFGAEYAADDASSGLVVDIEEMVHGSIEIPVDDYRAMVNAGIKNPNARKYWAGYNDYILSTTKEAEMLISTAIGNSGHLNGCSAGADDGRMYSGSVAAHDEFHAAQVRGERPDENEYGRLCPACGEWVWEYQTGTRW